MPDMMDEASDLSEAYLKTALLKRKDEPKRTGFCLYCEEYIGLDKPFCNADCRNDYDQEQEIRNKLDSSRYKNSD